MHPSHTVQTQDFWTPPHALDYPSRLPLGFCKLHACLHASRVPRPTLHSPPSPPQPLLPRALDFFHSWACPNLPYSICIICTDPVMLHFISARFFLSHNPCNSIPRYAYTQQNACMSSPKTCPGIFIAALLVGTSNQKRCKRPSGWSRSAVVCLHNGL